MGHRQFLFSSDGYERDHVHESFIQFDHQLQPKIGNRNASCTMYTLLVALLSCFLTPLASAFNGTLLIVHLRMVALLSIFQLLSLFLLQTCSAYAPFVPGNPFRRYVCASALDAGLDWRWSFGRIRTAEDVIFNRSFPAVYRNHLHVMHKSEQGSKVIYIRNPKAGSSLVRYIFQFKGKGAINRGDGPVFLTAREPVARLISAYGTIQARAFAEILRRYPELKEVSSSDFFKWLERFPILTIADLQKQGKARTNKLLNFTEVVGLSLVHLPFFRVSRESDRFVQFVSDILQYGFFEEHLLTQSYIGQSSDVYQHPAEIFGFVRTECLLEGLKQLLSTPHLKKMTHLKERVSNFPLKTFSLHSQKANKRMQNQNELTFTLRESKLGVNLLRDVFQSAAAPRALLTKLSRKAIETVQQLYKQDYACFQYPLQQSKWLSSESSKAKCQSIDPIQTGEQILKEVHSTSILCKNDSNYQGRAKLDPIEVHRIGSEHEKKNQFACYNGSFVGERILFPTVGRSGDTLFRPLYTIASALPTAAVYKGKRRRWNGDVQAWVETSHEEPNSSQLIVKSHFPFSGERKSEFSCVSRVLLMTRHPVANFLDWLQHKGNLAQPKNSALRRGDDFLTFLKAWIKHHSYWSKFAITHGIPLLQFRFEDLCRHPCFTLQRILNFAKVKKSTEASTTQITRFTLEFCKRRAKPYTLEHLSKSMKQKLSRNHPLSQYRRMLENFHYELDGTQEELWTPIPFNQQRGTEIRTEEQFATSSADIALCPRQANCHLCAQSRFLALCQHSTINKSWSGVLFDVEEDGGVVYQMQAVDYLYVKAKTVLKKSKSSRTVLKVEDSSGNAYVMKQGSHMQAGRAGLQKAAAVEKFVDFCGISHVVAVERVGILLNSGAVPSGSLVAGSPIIVSEFFSGDELKRSSSHYLNQSQVKTAVVFDFLIANCDRHEENILLDKEGNIKLIDTAEGAFGTWGVNSPPCQEWGPGHKTVMIPDNRKFFTAKTRLQYNCYAESEKIGKEYPIQLRGCIGQIAAMDIESLEHSFSLPSHSAAQTLHERAILLRDGFEEAIKKNYMLKYGKRFNESLFACMFNS